MTITHVNTQFGTPNTGSSPGTTSTSTVTKPTGLAVGDVMIAVVNANKAGITAPSIRWTKFQTNDSAANLYRQEIWYCVATSSETGATNFVWTNGDSAAPIWAAIAAYRGVSQTSPVNTSNVNIATTTNPQTGPSITTTSTSLVLNVRTVRHSSGTTTFSSSVTNERFDNGNNSTVGYFGAMYDSGATAAAGTISGVSITASSGTNQTDTISATIALAVADVSASAGRAAATAAANGATTLTGISVAAGKASVTAAAGQPSALSGRVAFAGAGAATASAAQPGLFAPAGVATVTACPKAPTLFFGTPGYRLKVVEAENRVLVVGQE